MVKYIFTNIIGSFVFNEKLELVDKSDSEETLLKKFKDIQKPDNKVLKQILQYFHQKQFFQQFYEKNLAITKQKIKQSVTKDLLVIHTINVIEDLTKIINMLITRLRDLYELYNPEFSKYAFDNEKFVFEILNKDKKQLLKEIHVKETMGADLEGFDLDNIMGLAKQIKTLYEHKTKHEQYLEKTMQKLCPNMRIITGAVLGAKLIEHAGSLEHLSELPASTIQLLGAEKALFRHMRTGAKCPKYGVLFEHPFVAQAKRQIQGKVARILADKISIAVKVDFFNGKFIGDKLLNDIKKRIKQ